jgi:hypothetical protein
MNDDNQDSLRQPLLPAESPIIDEEQQPTVKVSEQASLDDDGHADLDHDLATTSTDGPVVDVTNNSSNIPQDPSSNTWTWQGALHTTLIADNACTIRNVTIVEDPFAIKLLKFIVFTFLAIGFLHWLIVVSSSKDRDLHLKFWELWVYNGNLITSDCIVFFLVGRLWKQRGIDHLAWIGMVLLANLYFESQQYVSFLQHSLTLYEMSCGMSYIFCGSYLTIFQACQEYLTTSTCFSFSLVWPWQLWVFFAVVLPVCISVVIFHILRAYRTRVWVMKLVEVSVALLFYFAPLVGSPYFHAHHWYVGWLVGMHCNFDVWWSRACMAFLWGSYINGIAVYGRDPVLTCKYAYFLTVDQNCPYVNCFLEALANSPTATHDTPPMNPSDWRNCSADGYHG